MDPQVVLVLTWVIAGLIVAAYIWFVVWRYRVEQRKKAAQEVEGTAMSATIARTVERMATQAPAPAEKGDPLTVKPAVTPAPTATVEPMPTRAPERTSAPVSVPAPTPGPTAATTEATVAGMLKGVSLPNDLAPLTTMAPRAGAGDRVAFWTDRAPAEIVGRAFGDELERLGYEIAALDERSLSATRDGDRLLVVIHPDGQAAIIGSQPAFTSVPEQSVVIEVWIPE